MLANTVDIENVDGTHTYSLNAAVDNPFSPLRDFDVTVDDRSDVSRNKMQQAGAWPTRSYEGSMTCHIEGILSADTSANYWADRQALLLACRGVPGVNVTNRKRGTLFVTPQGQTERWMVDFGGFTFSAPVTASFPTQTDILLSLACWTPWFIGETSGNYYWWS